MYLISDSTPPEMYEFYAASKDDKNIWIRHVQHAVSKWVNAHTTHAKAFHRFVVYKLRFITSWVLFLHFGKYKEKCNYPETIMDCKSHRKHKHLFAFAEQNKCSMFFIEPVLSSQVMRSAHWFLYNNNNNTNNNSQMAELLTPEARHSSGEAHFCLYPFFGHYPELVTIGEGRVIKSSYKNETQVVINCLIIEV